MSDPSITASDLPDDDGGYQPSRTDTDDLAVAIKNFEILLPGWWWSVCHCALSRDASCGPDARVLGMAHPHVQMFDEGFHEAHEGTLADALRSVTSMALEAVDNG